MVPAADGLSPSTAATASPATHQTNRAGAAVADQPAAPAAPAAANPAPLSAASRYGWTHLVTRDDFNGSSLDPSWRAYNASGHAGKGVRSPQQITLSNGVLRITGTANGTTGGMSSNHPQKYGRWEMRVRLPTGCGCYHPVLILWPAEKPWPAGGEIDYLEVTKDPDRQTAKFFLHYSAQNKQLWAHTPVDMTKWHTYAVEWTPDHVTAFVDAEPVFRTTRRDVLPPGPMKQTVQLDWFPDSTRSGAVMEVDWATMYRL